MQVYELLAEHRLYLQTDQPLGKTPFTFVLRVNAEQACVQFEASTNALSVSSAINPLIGLQRYQLINAASELDFEFECWDAYADFGLKLYRAFESGDILYLNAQGSFDAQREVVIRHVSAVADKRSPLYRSAVFDAVDGLFQHASVQGHIACIGSGAGLVMATADAVQHLVGDPSVRVYALAEIEEAYLLTHLQPLLAGAVVSNTRIIIVTIFTTFVSCSAIADILLAFHTANPHIRMIVYLEGIDSDLGRNKFEETAVYIAQELTTIAHAVQIIT
ncbi:hypothetical protein VZO05_05290 [Aggregatilineales bacterium SYSU G02658]